VTLLALVATCISFTFINPFSHQTNIMVMVPGGYSALTFATFGAPLVVVSLATGSVVAWVLLRPGYARMASDPWVARRPGPLDRRSNRSGAAFACWISPTRAPAAARRSCTLGHLCSSPYRRGRLK
jgi:hypothetical protein